MGYKELESSEMPLSEYNGNRVLGMESAVQSAVMNTAEKFRDVVGSLPMVTTNSLREGDVARRFMVTTYGAGNYRMIADFSMAAMPGCCGVVIFYHASIAKDFTRRGLGSLLLDVRERAAVLAGYTMAQCTTLKKNKAQIKLLENAGWLKVNSFINIKTGNEVFVFMKKLNRS